MRTILNIAIITAIMCVVIYQIQPSCYTVDFSLNPPPKSSVVVSPCIPATGEHSYVGTVTKAPICEDEGVETWVCENCGDSYTTSIPATGEHTWVEQTTTIHHDEVGHYETQVIEEAYDEPIKETKQVCNYKGCGAYFDTTDEVFEHILVAHDGNASYSSKKVVTGTIHHDAVTKDVWVVDKEAYDETVVTGYKCSVCGAIK